MSTTTIEWTRGEDGALGKTWNPIRGCSRVSAGCDSCYAMGQAHRFSGPGKPFEGLTTIRKGKVDWTGRAVFVPGMLDQPLRWKKPRRIFANSMSDLFHESLSNEEIAAVFGVMAACPQHTFQVLTKRPKRAREWFAWVGALGGIAPYIRAHANELRGFFDAGMRTETYRGIKARSSKDAWCQVFNAAAIWSEAPLQNVHLGVSVEDQKTADDRISELLEIPAAVRFISYEPALCGVDLFAFLKGRIRDNCLDILKSPPMPGLDWVIVGGESGPGARPFDVAWARSIIEQCREAGVACFVKQLGAKPIDSALRDVWANGKHHYTKPPDDPLVLAALERSEYRVTPHDVGRMLRHKKGGEMSEWPDGLRVREFPRSAA